MVEILPFRGLHYSPPYIRASVFAPPYDVISPAERQAYAEGNPHNIVRLILGAQPGDQTWHAQAAATLAEWMASGVLERDAAPALYGYRQEFALADGRKYTRTGFMGRLRLAEWGDGVHRHERTKLGPRVDRLALMRATHANMSPVFGLYPDPEGKVGRWLEPPANPLVDVQDGDGVRHVFWRIEDPAVVQAISGAMAERDVVIADGHHRYETALAYRAERRAADGNPDQPQPYDYVLMYLTALEDPGLVVLPTHRVISGDLPSEGRSLLDALSVDFELSPVGEQDSLGRAIADAADGTVAIGACLAESGCWLLKLRDLERARVAAGDRVPDELATLDVCVLQNLILEPHLGIGAEKLATGEQVTYTIHEQEARKLVAGGEARAAFILNPTSVERVWRAARQGVVMPQKSTYFYPKLLSGLVLNPLD
jgi:uncharacterized protein (DUF1015 family)